MFRRFAFALEITCLMYLAAIVFGFPFFWRALPNRWDLVVGYLGPPATAALAFFLVGLLFRRLFAESRIASPLPFTLPLVYVALVVTINTLGIVGDGTLLSVPPKYLGILVWTNGMTLASVWLGQTVLLGLIAARRHSPSKLEH